MECWHKTVDVEQVDIWQQVFSDYLLLLILVERILLVQASRDTCLFHSPFLAVGKMQRFLADIVSMPHPHFIQMDTLYYFAIDNYFPWTKVKPDSTVKVEMDSYLHLLFALYNEDSRIHNNLKNMTAAFPLLELCTHYEWMLHKHAVSIFAVYTFSILFSCFSLIAKID